MAADNADRARARRRVGRRVRVCMGSVESAPFPMALGSANRRQPSSRGQSRGGFRRQRLRHVQRPARPESSRLALQSHVEPRREAIHHRADESHRPRDRSRRLSFRFLPQRRHDPSRIARRPLDAMDRRHGHRHRPCVRQEREAFTWATAAARFSKSAPTAKFSSSPRSNLRISAYHLAFSPAGELFVTGPTTSSFDRVYRISPAGEVSVFFRGLGRPQGLAFDRTEIFTSRRRSEASAASCASRRRPKRNCPRRDQYRRPRASAHPSRHDRHQRAPSSPSTGTSGPSPQRLAAFGMRGGNHRNRCRTPDPHAVPAAITNYSFLIRRTEQLGIRVIHKAVVGDAPDEMRSSFRQRARPRGRDRFVAAASVPPTTTARAQTVADLLGRKLHSRRSHPAQILERFRRYGRPMPEINERQAMVIEGATILPNPRGTRAGSLDRSARPHPDSASRRAVRVPRNF